MILGRANLMVRKQLLKRIGIWILTGMAIIAVPVLLPASVSVGQRFGLLGGLLLWMYMGRQVENEQQPEE